jgi:outer membrane protein assembly factor BamB
VDSGVRRPVRAAFAAVVATSGLIIALGVDPALATTGPSLTSVSPPGLTAASGRSAVATRSATLSTPKVVQIAPTVGSFRPLSGAVGRLVTIKGTGFTQPCTVTFNRKRADCRVDSTTEIATAVPAFATTGPISVRTGGGRAVSTATFTVTLGIGLSVTSGPPTTPVTVSGSGFAPNEAVDLYIGTSDEALVATDGSGNFQYARLPVPRSSEPGTTWVSAVGRRSGRAAQQPFVVRANWAERGFGPAHRGTNPYENTLSPLNVGGIDRQWSHATGDAVLSSPTVVNGVVYIGSEDGEVYALNASTGAKRWSYATGGSILSSPTVVNGVVYIGSFDANVYALDAATGAKLWNYATGSAISSSPAVVNGVVYVGSLDNSVYAIDASTGAKLWNYPTAGAVTSSPAVVSGVVYVGSFDTNLYALEASTGAKLWSYATAGTVTSSPAVVNGVVYVGSLGGNLYAVKAANGAWLWTYTAVSGISSSPAVVNGVVYVGAYDDNVYAVDAATGTQLWGYTTGGVILSSPAVANGVVYIGSMDGDLYGLDASTGAELWSYPTRGGVESSPAVVNGVVYAGSHDGKVYAFGLAGSLADRMHRVTMADLRPG